MNIINECLEELNSTNSSNAKKEILSKYKNEELVKQFFKYTYEPRYSYYIRNLKFFDNKSAIYITIGDFPLPPTDKFPTPIIGVLNFVEEKIPQSYILFLRAVTKW